MMAVSSGRCARSAASGSSGEVTVTGSSIRDGCDDITGRQPGLVGRAPGDHSRHDRSTDEIFAAVDWMPTLAGMVGEIDRVPTDRPIDGVDSSDLILGRRATWNREDVLSYVSTGRSCRSSGRR